MRSRSAASPAGSPALFGTTRQAVLRIIFGHVDRRFYQRQIIRLAGLGSGAVQRELAMLAGTGVITRSVEGRQTYFQANRRSPIFEELRSLVRKTFGLAQVLQEALAPLASGIRLAFVYGSVAEGRETSPSDVDVMIVGPRISWGDVVSALASAEPILGREVNPSVYTTAEFCRKLAGGHHFLNSVVSSPKLFLIGDDGKLAGLAEIRMARRAQDKPAGNRRPSRTR